jgi:5-hydroxyisourate hydrolase-like protein (transthyretin family)
MINKILLKETMRRLLTTRKQAYLQTFKGIPAEKVLADLARFCRANESTFNPDPRLAANLDGRREVWLRIQQHLNMTDDELYKLNDVYEED